MTLERRLKPTVAIDLTPLIDVIFQLVIFFMITTVFKTAPGIALALPESSSSAPVAVSELKLSVVSADEILVNRRVSDLRGLEAAIRAEIGALPEGKKTAANLEAAANLDYQTVMRALDCLRKAGVTDIDLITAPARTRAGGGTAPHAPD